MDQEWSVGVTLTFPLFTGLSTKYQVDEAKANLDVFKANEDLLMQKVYLQVESAYLSLKEAAERISAGKIIVKQAEETVELAKGRYSAGVGSSIEITDAMITLNNAKMTYITALSDYSVAQANLEKAMGAGAQK
jgi:outer membrane protein TolC